MRGLLAAILIVPALAGCFGSDPVRVPLDDEVEIVWTAHGIPHITADTFYGLGKGSGYAAAEDNLCLIAEEYVTVNGERAKYFGPGSYWISSNGQTFTNVQSDTFWRIHGGDLVTSSAGWADQRGQDLLHGYVEGYNHYLKDLPEGRHESCRDEDWLRPITADDMERRVNKLQLLASSLFFAPYMVDASPLPGFAPGTPAGRLPTPEGIGMGSNGYAFGSAATGGNSLLLGNPHFSWSGPERFSQLHLTVPGEYDVMGTSLMGVPLVLIGFNEDVAWTHTVSTGWRFTAYELKLVPGDPMSYLHDGEVLPITTRTAEVEVLRNGRITTERHSIHFSHYGPMIEFPLDDQLANLPEPAAGEIGLMWNPATAYTMRDANAHNDRIFQQFFAFGVAKNLDDIERSLDTIHGIPWVNTIAADRHSGEAFYGDISVVPNVPDALWDSCNTPVGVGMTQAARLPVLDGSTSDCDWLTTRADGALPATEMPRVRRDDFVINSNDSYWLPNPAQPLEGYARMIGAEQSERSQRTRMGFVLIDDALTGSMAGVPGSPPGMCDAKTAAICGSMTMEKLQIALFSSRLHAAEDVVQDLLDETCVLGTAVASDGTVVNLQEACDVLAKWDRKADLDSRGLALFERFWLAAPDSWQEPFDPADPVRTPTDYAGLDPRAGNALADAVLDLRRAGMKLDVAVKEVRYSERDGERIPLHGANGGLGSPSMMTFPWTDGQGWGEVVHGNSYMQTVTWDDNGPVAEALLSYSQSSDPASPFSADQTKLYSQKEWVRLPFTADQVEAQQIRSLRL